MNYLIQRLQTNEIFEVLQEAELKEIAAQFQHTSLPAGSSIYQGGDHRHRVYFVQSGKIQVMGGEHDQDKLLLVYREGNYFGEACLLDESSHSTSARVVEDSELWYLEREQFLAYMERNPLAAAKMISRAGRVVFRRLMADCVIMGLNSTPPCHWFAASLKSL